jgi:hypothetical protein
VKSLDVKVDEMIAREVGIARTWLIAAGVVSLVVQMLFAYNLPPKIQHLQKVFVIIAIAQFSVYFGLWLVSHRKPKPALIIALVIYWAGQIAIMVAGPPSDIVSPSAFVVRLAITLALIGGISAATRAEELARTRAAQST